MLRGRVGSMWIVLFALVTGTSSTCCFNESCPRDRPSIFWRFSRSSFDVSLTASATDALLEAGCSRWSSLAWSNWLSAPLI